MHATDCSIRILWLNSIIEVFEKETLAYLYKKFSCKVVLTILMHIFHYEFAKKLHSLFSAQSNSISLPTIFYDKTIL
jgi:hypothetical protein